MTEKAASRIALADRDQGRSSTLAGERTGPLSDLRILDLTQALAGPYGTALLADLGADVVKIEPPGGDIARPMPPLLKDYAPPGSKRPAGCDYGGYFASINRNKRSIVLDLRRDDDRDRFLELAVRADAVIENSRVGVMDRLGIGYDVLRGANPQIVYAAIRGFGDPRTGESPYAQWPAFDIVAQCMGGLVGITGPTESAGYPNGASVGDLFPGALMALGVVSAVHAARRTGKGQFLDVSMYDAILSLCETLVINYSCANRVLGPRGSGHPALCPFDVYETSDGAVAIAAPTDNHWEALCEIVGRPDLVEDERTRDNRRRSENRALVTEILTVWTGARTKKEVVRLLGGKVPVGPVNNAADVFADPHVWLRQMLVEIEPPGDNPTMMVVGTPIKLTETPAGVYRRPPRLGEHTAEILAEIRQGAKPGADMRRGGCGARRHRKRADGEHSTGPQSPKETT
jgi:crotonobetainyl-CoA:carnitine CoA-transferase CaiB-like acyl-CoA transferase